MMEALLFLGCTVPVRNLNYELSARKVAEALGITFHDLPGGGCCGFPLKGTDQESALVLAARVLALAGERDLPLVTLCSACAGSLAEAAHVLDHDPERRAKIQEALAKMGLEYRPGVKVRHFVRVLLEEVGPEAIREKVKVDLSAFSFAPHYGCHYLKPSEVTGAFDDPEDPRSMASLIEASGARVVNYRSMKDCCGGGILGADEELAAILAGRKLQEVDCLGADALVVICPFCNVMYEGQQKAAAKRLEASFKVPVVYLTQVLGLALGFSQEDLGFKMNRMKPKEMLKALAG